MPRVLFFCFMVPGIELGLTFAREVLYHLSYTPSPFALKCSDRVSDQLCSGWSQTMILLPLPLELVGQQICTTMLSLFFIIGLATFARVGLLTDPPTSNSGIGGITGVYHYTQLFVF
jgi:hypothetical protein